jgi:Mu transposase, C-terminal
VERFLMDFLPVRNCVITREGIEIDGLRFSQEALQSEVNPHVQRVVRIDPRDTSRVYLESTDGSYVTIPMRGDQAMHRMSWWEWRSLRRQRNAKKLGDATEIGPSDFPVPISKSRLRAGRGRVRRAEWQALQAIQALPAPDTRLHPVLRSDEDSQLPQWEILD